LLQLAHDVRHDLRRRRARRINIIIAMNSFLRFVTPGTLRAALAGVFVLSSALFPSIAAAAADASPAEAVARVETFEVLKTKTAEYRNVTVTARNATEIHIRHDGGVQNVKLAELDDDTLAALGFPRKVSAAENMESRAGDAMKALMAKLPASVQPAAPEGGDAGADAEGSPGYATGPNPLPLLLATMGPQVILAVLAVAAMAYLFSCYCLKLICEKAGSEPGLLIWLPVLQIFPMLRAAGMSQWWFLGFCVPGINLIAQILWAVKISEARGKSIWTAICLILPVTNVFAFLYLAFSSAKGSGADTHKESSGELQISKSRKIILGAPNPLRPTT
jgi:hypothetical protein